MSVDDIIIKQIPRPCHSGKEYVFKAFLNGKEVGKYVFTYDPRKFSNLASENVRTYVSFLTMNKGYFGKRYSKEIMRQAISQFKGIVRGKTIHLIDITRLSAKDKNGSKVVRQRKIHKSFQEFFESNGYKHCNLLDGMINKYGKNFTFIGEHK